ncbi:MAG: hypothetical protein HUJ98_04040 [Bacteroidaceae bacterium]|nr:hypothetical protein [Bacteroidaceae bacterium]
MSVIRVQCLQNVFIPFKKLNAYWKIKDKRYPEQAIQRFLTFNKEAFAFLGLNASLDEVNYEKGLSIIASNFVGAAPIRLPSSGKYYSDIQITSRFGENISELAFLLKDTLEPEYLDKDLYQSDNLRAPFYFDCINYFNTFIKALSEPWNKFDTIIKIETHPCSSTNWSKYVRESYDIAKTLQYSNKKNVLSRDHNEWQKLTFMLSMALSEFASFKTPSTIKLRYSSVVSILSRYLNEHQRVKPMTMFQIHSFEPAIIKELKKCANILLEHNSANKKAWRIDSAELFERYVQYILRQVGKISGAHVMSNNKFPIYGNYRPAWVIKYLEPDVIMHKDDTFFFADAKYKAHMLNVQSSAEVFKEAFRSDLHQVLAYSSFDSSRNKTAMLVYPCNKFKNIRLEAVNKIGNVQNQIFLIGLPFSTVGLDAFVDQVSNIFRTDKIQYK